MTPFAEMFSGPVKNIAPTSVAPPACAVSGGPNVLYVAFWLPFCDAGIPVTVPAASSVSIVSTPKLGGIDVAIAPPDPIGPVVVETDGDDRFIE